MGALTVDDIAARTGREITGTLRTQVEAWITDAVARAGQLVPELDPEDLAAAAHAILAAAVVRCVYNPAGVRSYSAGAISFSAGQMSNHGAAGPVLAPADVDALRAAYGRSSVYSVRTPSRRAHPGDRSPTSRLDCGGENR